jgi:hypothetical protein
LVAGHDDFSRVPEISVRRLVFHLSPSGFLYCGRARGSEWLKIVDLFHLIHEICTLWPLTKVFTIPGPNQGEGREGESRGSAQAEFHLAAQQRLGSVFEQASGETALPGIALSKEFAKVVREQKEEGKQDSSKGPKTMVNSAEDKPKRRRRRRRRRDRDIDRGR